MQVFPIVLVAVLLAADSGLRWRPFALEPLTVVGLAWGSVLAVIVVVAGLMHWYAEELRKGRTPGPLIAADRTLRFSRWILLTTYAIAVLVCGWLDVVRDAVGDLVLIDELLTMAPPLLGLAVTWWLHYPVERRMRDALIVRRLDLGQPIYPTISRWAYVSLQTRLHLLLLFVPILLILGLGEAIGNIGQRFEISDWITQVVTLGGVFVIFLFAPLLARFLLDVVPLPQCELRDALLDVCRRHDVRVRDLLMWRTNGTVINAAVMGFISPLRYVMLTDALLDTMTMKQVQAVMAHEVGHVRRHHMPWLVGSFIAAIMLAMLASLGIERLLVSMDIPIINAQNVGMFEIGIVGGQLFAALLLFGWISRRFERQADTFAVQHLSTTATDDSEDSQGSEVVKPQAVAAMSDALLTISRLNAIHPNRYSWRHGSIRWRQNYLATIVGLPVGRLGIDRTVRWLKGAIAVTLVLCSIGVVRMELEAAQRTSRLPDSTRTDLVIVESEAKE